MAACPALHARLPCLTCLPHQFLAGQGKLPIESTNLIAGLQDGMPVYDNHSTNMLSSPLTPFLPGMVNGQLI